MTFTDTFNFLQQHFANEMVWCVVDEYHQNYGGEDVLNGPMSFQQALVHKQSTESRQPGRHSRIVFDYSEVIG